MRLGFKILIFIIIAYSCGNTRQTDNALINVEISTAKSKKVIGLSEIVDSVNFIKLYTDSKFLIGDIRNIVIADKLFVQNFNKVLIFNLDGSPYSIVDSKGKAKGEYYEINDFYVDTLNMRIEIWDKVSRKLLHYNYNAEFIKEQSIDIDADYFKKVGECYYYLSSGTYLKKGEDDYKIICINKNGEIIDSYFKSEYINLYSFSTPAFLSSYDNSIFFEDAPLGKIYKINNSKCQLYYSIIIDGNTITKEEFTALHNLRAPERFRKLNESFNYSIGNTYLWDNQINFDIRANNTWYFCLYNLDNNQYLLSESLIEEKYLKLDIWGRFVSNNYFIGYFPSYKIINSVNEYFLEEKNCQLYQLVKDLKQIDNPIIVVGKLKKIKSEIRK